GVATAWNQIGRIYHQTKQYEQGERAFRQSLAISVQRQDAAGEASSLNELGRLYNVMKREEEAVKCYRQAADTYVRLGDQKHEGVTRSNLAASLMNLQRYNEARIELNRALECKRPYGHAGKPWLAWDLLTDLELEVGNIHTAAQARKKAIESFLSYR